MFYSLPPAGNPVLLKQNDQADEFLSALFFPFQAFYFNSGAASLAVAIKAIMLKRGVEKGEVLLPAYACPEIVSAIQYTGATPVLVDLELDLPLMDLNCLQKQVTDNTVAVIAVSLFGIPERMKEISSIVKPLGVDLIEDNAQRFLDKGETIHTDSEAVIFSFGRGKPVSVLSGGVLLVKDRVLIEYASEISSTVPITQPKYLRSKISVYNFMISPYFYWLPETLPFLGLGQTVFKPLDEPRLLSDVERSLIPSNIQHFWGRTNKPQKWIKGMLSNVDSEMFTDIATIILAEKFIRLLRYPVLARSPEVRDSLVAQLRASGLGVSCMYPLPLNRIAGLEALNQSQNKTPVAAGFASRIFTLPVHSGIKQKDCEKIGELMRVAQ